MQIGSLIGTISSGWGDNKKIQVSKTVTPSAVQQTVKPDEGYSGLARVVVEAMPAPKLQTKSVVPADDPQTVTADAGYQGLASVQVGANIDTLPYWVQKTWSERMEIAAPNSWSEFWGLSIADLVLTDWGTIHSESPGLRGNTFTRKLTIKNSGPVGYGAFRGMTALTECVIESSKISSIDILTFEGDTALQTVKLSDVTGIYASAFSGCSSLNDLYLQSSTMCSLYNTNAFNGTPFASGTGTIHVPAALLSSYKTATNWSVFADRFVGDL